MLKNAAFHLITSFWLNFLPKLPAEPFGEIGVEVQKSFGEWLEGGKLFKTFSNFKTHM